MRFWGLRLEYLYELAGSVANRTAVHVGGTFETADLVSTWRKDTVDGVVVANDALSHEAEERQKEKKGVRRISTSPLCV